MERKMFEANLLDKQEEANKMDKERDELLAEIETKKRKVAEIEGKSPEKSTERKEPDIEQLKKDWENFYRDTFKIKSNFSQIEIPEKREGFEKLIIMEKGLTAQKLFDKCKELFLSRKRTDKNLDKVVTSDRSAKEKAYAIWVRDRIEADEELKNLSADDVKKQKLITETLEERLLQELEYFTKNKEHLDTENVTLCAGSRCSDGSVPHVDWRDGGLSVFRYGPDFRGGRLRPRQAVSSAEGGN